ncbi:CrcB family protein [Streptomyces sp. NPDC004232]|uniref:FluC/FEX family fluoride channel n=1 Tax=Streptomyces sp. NPDC004232 TaxID=3154454 RepID=UPI001D4676D4|nr:CrcB family protein [Streptomyces sp. tea 10]
MALLLGILGGAGGAALRYALEKSVFQVWSGVAFPLASFTVNFAGCFLLGVALGRASACHPPGSVYVLLGGAITAFSVFGHQLLEFLRSGQHGMAGLRALVGWLVGTAAAVMGVLVSMS